MKISKIKYILIISIILVQLSFPVYSQSQNSLSENKVDSLLQLISKYEYGMDRTATADFSSLVVKRLNSSKSYTDLESKMIEFLNSNATLDGKRFICKELSLIGTGESVDILISMLTENSTSDMARFALERIKNENVDPKLIQSLDNVDDHSKIGIINTLAVRNSELALNKISEYVLSDNPVLSNASASALGKIAGTKSSKIISELLYKTEGNTHNLLLDSYLMCADKFLKENKNKDAINIYSQILEKEKLSSQRIAALKGIILASSDNRVSIILKTLKSSDNKLKEVAVQHIRELSLSTEYEKIIESFSSINENEQIQIIYAIKELGLSYFHDLIEEVATEGAENVRVAAVDCLEKLGTVNDIELLSRLSLDKNNQIKTTARNSLDNLTGKNIDEKILELIPTSLPEIQIELIRSVGERMILDGFDTIVKTAQSANQKVRVESYKTLGIIANPDQQEILMKIFLSIENNAELKRMESTLAKVSLKNNNQNERAQIFLDSFEKTDDFEKQMSILRILGSTGDTRALKYIRTSLGSENEDVKKTAIQSLNNWTNLEPLDDLLEIVKTSPNNTHQILALRGYINLVKAQGLNANADVIELYKTALEYSKYDNEKIMIISGVGTVLTLDGLHLASSFLEDENLRPEAEIACFNVIDRVRWSQPDEAIKVLDVIRLNPTSKEIGDHARNLIKDIK